MNCISINIQGLGGLKKWRWVRDLCNFHRVNFLAIQESKLSHVELWKLCQLWGNTQFDFAISSARGMSGGIISLWNSGVFARSSITCCENYIVVDGHWIPDDVKIRWINVYAPQSLPSKVDLWNNLLRLSVSWDGIVIIMGDFNEVRFLEERHGSSFNDRQANLFNDFIDGASLIDIPPGGYNFTWMDKWGSKMSKLDRFLVSNNFLDFFPHATGVVLDKGTPDHRPNLLKELQVDYGPTPFKFFHSWLEMEGFSAMVEQTWRNDNIVHKSKMVVFKKKTSKPKKYYSCLDWLKKI